MIALTISVTLVTMCDTLHNWIRNTYHHTSAAWIIKQKHPKYLFPTMKFAMLSTEKVTASFCSTFLWSSVWENNKHEQLQQDASNVNKCYLQRGGSEVNIIAGCSLFVNLPSQMVPVNWIGQCDECIIWNAIIQLYRSYLMFWNVSRSNDSLVFQLIHLLNERIVNRIRAQLHWKFEFE